MTVSAVSAISAAVEGMLDEAVVRRLVRHAGALAGTVYGKNGKPFLKERIAGYNNAARHAPWIVLVDLDSEHQCPPPLRETWLPHPAPQMCFRVAVRAVEAWLMADAERLAAFIGVPRRRIPADPEREEYPKQAMVNLARSSRRRDVREDMVPRDGSGRTVGPAYTSRLVEYATDRWRPHVAARSADSLQRAVACLRRLAAGADASRYDA